MSALASAQTLHPPQAITDPKQLNSKPNAQVEQGEQSLSIEKLYMTRAIGGSTWSPDGKTIVFVSNISGRNNFGLSRGKRLAAATHGKRPTADAARVVAGWQVDRLSVDYDGDEQWDIFTLAEEWDGGESN